MKCLSIFVSLVAALMGIFAYKFYLPISPKLPQYSTAIVMANNAIFSISYAAEKFGIGSAHTIMRFLYKALDRPSTLLARIDELVIVEDTTISGVPVRIYRQKNIVDHDQGRPGLIFFHGGGLSLHAGRSYNYDGISFMLTNATDSVVISVDYRLAPENLFPAQFQDCYSVVSTVMEKRMKYGITDEKIVLGGDSAGGLLAAAVSLELVKKKRGNHIAAQFLVCPWLQSIDVTCLPSYQDYSQGFLLPKEQMAYFSSLVVTGKLDLMQQYVSGNVSRYFMHTPYWKLLQNPENSDCKASSKKNSEDLPSQFIEAVVDSRLSPLLADTVEGLPPTFIAVAEYDVLASEGNLFADRLKKADVPVVHKIYRSYHGFYMNVLHAHKSAPVAKEAFDDLINYLNSVFHDN